MRARGAFPWREACSSRCIIMLRCCTVGVSHLLPLWRLSSGNIVILGKRKPQGLSSNRKALVQGRNQGMHTGPRAASWHLHQAMGTEPQPRTKHAPENNHQRHCFLRFFRTTTPLHGRTDVANYCWVLVYAESSHWLWPTTYVAFDSLCANFKPDEGDDKAANKYIRS